jgi:hypothetical protein
MSITDLALPPAPKRGHPADKTLEKMATELRARLTRDLDSLAEASRQVSHDVDQMKAFAELHKAALEARATRKLLKAPANKHELKRTCPHCFRDDIDPRGFGRHQEACGRKHHPRRKLKGVAASHAAAPPTKHYTAKGTSGRGCVMCGDALTTMQRFLCSKKECRDENRRRYQRGWEKQRRLAPAQPSVEAPSEQA